MMIKRLLTVIFVMLFAGAGAWALYRFIVARRAHSSTSLNQSPKPASGPAEWYEAVEKVKADRAGEGGGALTIPPELKHYSERHWFLATQVAEVARYSLPTCQDYVELAGMIQRGEIVAVPTVTDTFVLFGVGAKADEKAFTKYKDGSDVELYDEVQLSEAYKELETKRKSLAPPPGNRPPVQRSGRKNSKDQPPAQSREQELKIIDEKKALLDEFYGQPGVREKLLQDYNALVTLAKDFGGRSYDLNNPADRQVLKITLLSSLRPEALKVLEEVAAAYHDQFGRPLPISSLLRPEQYQRALRRVNRNAVLIESPPHSTGLAFDIDYRYMSVAEQNFLMVELARIKREGRIEVIRERNANYHVFAFLNGTRPSDDLITASLDEANTDATEAHHTTNKAVQPRSKSRKRPVKHSPKPALKPRKRRR